MSAQALSDGTPVYVTVMHAYPDGCLLAFDLGSVLLPAASALPADIVDVFKSQLAGGEEAQGEQGKMQAAGAAERLRDLLLDPSRSDALLMGAAKALMLISDRQRFERLSGQLLATLTVQHDGQMIELTTKASIQRVVGTNLKRCLELLFVALRGNMSAFFSGSGDMLAAASSAPAPRRA